MGKFDVEKGTKLELSVFFFEYMPFPHSLSATGNRVFFIIKILCYGPNCVVSCEVLRLF